jgi:3-isopropylmalate/(R)-2-methylmalate dehydratase small subunit
MALAKISSIEGTGVYVPGDDIDTDRIIPARFMKCVTFDGLGEYLFHDVKFEQDGSKKEHALNDPTFADASILVSGSNFGCGSSREHAPQSLYRAGFRGIIAGNYAEIFFGNSINLGMPCVSMSADNRLKLVSLIEAAPTTKITIDLVELQVRANNLALPVDIREGARDSLLNGMWDPLEELVGASTAVDKVASNLFYT